MESKTTKYAKFDEKPTKYECVNSRCKWTGTKEQKGFITKGRGQFKEPACPHCGETNFYGLIEIELTKKSEE